MSMKLFWKYALPALLAIALPLTSANAQTVTPPVYNNEAAGVVVTLDDDDTDLTAQIIGNSAANIDSGSDSGTSVSYGVNALDWTNVTAQLTGDLTGVSITSSGGTNNWVQTTLTLGNITLGVLDANGNNVTGLTIADGFAGTLNIGNITVESDGVAVGIAGGNNNLTIDSAISAFGSAATGITTTGTVTLNTGAAIFGDTLGVQAGTLTLADNFNNGGSGTVFTANATTAVNVGDLAWGAAADQIYAPVFNVAANKSANIGNLTFGNNSGAVEINLAAGSTLTALSDVTRTTSLTIQGSGEAVLMGLAGSFTLGDTSNTTTVTINGGNFDYNDTITWGSDDAILIVGGKAGAKQNDAVYDAANSLTGTTNYDGVSAQLDAGTTNADVTDGIRVVSASATGNTWGVVEDPSNSGTYYIVATGIAQGAQNTALTAHLLHDKYTVWNAVRDHLISGTTARRGFLGQAPCDPCGSILGTAARTAWVNYVGRANSYQDSFLNSAWKLGTDGVQVGSDLYRTKKAQFGVLFGYEGGKATLDLDEVKSDDVYVGFYGVRVLGNGADARILFNKGWQDFDMSRLSGAATSSFKGETTELTLELGKRFFRGAWSARPVVAFDYFTSETKAFEETFSGDVYEKNHFSQAFFRLGSDLKFERNHFVLNSGLYYSYDVHGEELQTTVNNSAMLGSKLGREVLTFNVGGSYLLGKSFTVFGGYQLDALLDADKNSTQHIGHVGGAWKW